MNKLRNVFPFLYYVRLPRNYQQVQPHYTNVKKILIKIRKC